MNSRREGAFGMGWILVKRARVASADTRAARRDDKTFETRLSRKG